MANSSGSSRTSSPWAAISSSRRTFFSMRIHPRQSSASFAWEGVTSEMRRSAAGSFAPPLGMQSDWRRVQRRLSNDLQAPIPWGYSGERSATRLVEPSRGPAGSVRARVVARRYRLAIDALQRRGTVYSCDATLTGYHAYTDSPSRVRLGPSFWTQNRMDRAATILHEMMHQYFLGFILHDPLTEHRRNNANCLANFALWVRGVTPPHIYVEACRNSPP